MLRSKEIKSSSRLISSEKRLWSISKKLKRLKEEERSWNCKSTINSTPTIKQLSKRQLTKKLQKRRTDSTKCGMLSGREKIRLVSICSKMCINLARRIFYWSKRCSAKPTGSRIMREHKWKLQLPSKMQNTKQELLRRLLLARHINLISWSRWTKKIECRDNTCRRKCTRREQRDWLSLNTRGKLQLTKLKMQQLNCREQRCKPSTDNS